MVPMNVFIRKLLPKLQLNSLTVTNMYKYYILLNAHNCLCYLHKGIFVSKHRAQTMYLVVQANRFRQNSYLYFFYMYLLLQNENCFKTSNFLQVLRQVPFHLQSLKKIEDDMRIVLLPEWKLPIQMQLYYRSVSILILYIRGGI